MIQLLASWQLPLNVLVTMLLCIVAFALGVRRRQLAKNAGAHARHATLRARRATRELCKVVDELFSSLRRHRWRLDRFQERTRVGDHVDVHDVERTVSMLRRLSSDLGLARLRVREQMDQLVALTESRIDALTGVANRRAFDEELESLVARQARKAESFALALIDLDQFKAINDALGHPAGDTVLRQAALAMVENTLPTDFVARTGGDEFGILMEDTDVERARRRAERVRSAVQAVADHLGGAAFAVTVSAGVAALKRNETAASLVARADAALYCSKAQRRLHDDAGQTEHSIAAEQPSAAGPRERETDPIRTPSGG